MCLNKNSLVIILLAHGRLAELRKHQNSVAEILSSILTESRTLLFLLSQRTLCDAIIINVVCLKA